MSKSLMLACVLASMLGGGCAHEMVREGACLAGESTSSATTAAVNGSSMSPGQGVGIAVGVGMMAAGAALDRGSRQQPSGTARPADSYTRQSGCRGIQQTR
jgi:hypothetical protein